MIHSSYRLQVTDLKTMFVIYNIQNYKISHEQVFYPPIYQVNKTRCTKIEYRRNRNDR